MNKHFSNIEIENFISGKYPLKEVFKISQHIIQCLKCRERAQEISPVFFQEAAVTKPPSNSLEKENHCSPDELKLFLKGELSIKQRLKMSDHIRDCMLCKRQMYQADPDYLKQTIRNYLETGEDTEHRTISNKFYIFGPILAFAVVIVFMSVFFIMNWMGRERTNEQAKIGSVEIQKTYAENITGGRPVVLDGNSNDSTPKIADSKAEDRTQPRDQAKLNKTNKSLADIEKLAVGKTVTGQKNNVNLGKQDKNNVIVSESRSLSNPCLSKETKIALTPYFEEISEVQPIFRWKAVPNAVKYQVYISDESKVLIDQFQTTEDTSFTSSAAFSEKNYKWQVIVTRADGTTLNSGLIEFSIGKTARKFSSKKKQAENNLNRCIQ